MSDPNASVKSIFSGKTIGDREMDPSSPSQSAVESERNTPFLEGKRYQGANVAIPRPFQPPLGSKLASAASSTISSTGSCLPVDSRLYPDSQELYDGKNNSTNISLISGTSDYQHAIASDYSGSDVCESFQGEPHSRPLSRNSATSCLSTTATKDGIEGKRIPRQQFKFLDHRFQPAQGSLQGLQSNSNHGTTGSSPSDTQSKLRSELDSMALPPISLSEKMQMMSNANSDEL